MSPGPARSFYRRIRRVGRTCEGPHALVALTKRWVRSVSQQKPGRESGAVLEVWVGRPRGDAETGPGPRRHSTTTAPRRTEILQTRLPC